MIGSAPLLVAKGLGKRYQRDCSPGQQVVNLLFGDRHGDAFWALSPLDLTLERGDAIGIIGRNGSGKSTLLQMLMGTLTATTGEIRTDSRVAGLLELGAGFDTDFTGRENAILNASSLGLSMQQVNERLPSIAEFADIGDFFDRPVLEYSSGMFARLAFAVAIHVDADILVVDEILSVGDSLFQRKCHQWMRNFRMNGGSLVYVSQNAMEMASVCPRAIWLDKGKVMAAGPSHEIAAAYQSDLLSPYRAAETEAAKDDEQEAAPAYFADPMHVRTGPFRPDAPQHGQGGARVIGVSWRFGAPDVNEFEGGQEIELRITCRAEKTLTQPIIGFIFRDASGQNLFGDNTYLATAESPPHVAPGGVLIGVFSFRFPYLPMGDYSLAPSIIEGTQDDHVHLHWMEDAMQIRVVRSPVEFGLVGVPMSRSTLALCD